MINSPVNTNPTGLAMIKRPTMRDGYSQTQIMPTIAIENYHMDCVHGPILTSPLDLAVQEWNSLKTEGNVDFNKFKQKKSNSTPVNSDEHTGSKESKKSTEIQTDFTSFTRPPHYFYPINFFNKYLILGSSESMPPNETRQQAQAFNTDFFTRFGSLFSMRFIAAYFHTQFKQSKL